MIYIVHLRRLEASSHVVKVEAKSKKEAGLIVKNSVNNSASWRGVEYVNGEPITREYPKTKILKISRGYSLGASTMKARES
jgi:hypothetical protein